MSSKQHRQAWLARSYGATAARKNNVTPMSSSPPFQRKRTQDRHRTPEPCDDNSRREGRFPDDRTQGTLTPLVTDIFCGHAGITEAWTNLGRRARRRPAVSHVDLAAVWHVLKGTRNHYCRTRSSTAHCQICGQTHRRARLEHWRI